MKNPEKALSTLQLILIIFLLGTASKLFMTPVILLKSGGRSAFFTMMIFCAVDLAALAFLLFAGKIAPDRSVFEIIEGTAGKIASKTVAVLFIVYAVIKITLLVTILKNYIATNIFDGFVWVVYSIPLILVLAMFGFRTLRSIGRTAEIFTPFILIAMTAIILLIASDVKFSRLLPLGGEPKAIASGMKQFPFWFGDYLLLVLSFGKVKECKKRFNTKVLLAAGVISFIVILCAVIIFAAYIDVARLLDYGKKISAITQISVARSNLGRYDIIIFCVWMVTIIITGGLYFFGLTHQGEYLLNIKKGHPYSSIIAAVLIYVLAGIVFENEGLLYQFLTGAFSYYAWAVQMGLPVLIFALAVIYRRKNSHEYASRKENQNI